MQNEPTQKKKKFEHLRQISQISEDHCGPAVLEMLLENIDVIVTQEKITEAAGAAKTIVGQGVRVDQMALAVKNLAKDATFWFKEKATLEDLVLVLDTYNHPVGVEWQGLFEDSLEDPIEEDAEDYGHYSIISDIDQEKNELIIVDPYKDFADQDRILKTKLFLKRWWDFNEICDPKTGVCDYKRDDNLFFIVTHKDETFPAELGMKKFEF